MRALDKHKAALEDKFKRGRLAIHPFYHLYNYAYKQAESKMIDSPEVAALRMMRIAESHAKDSRLCTTPGCDALLWGFEAVYEREPRKALKALKILLDCPPDPTYEDWLKQKQAR